MKKLYGGTLYQRSSDGLWCAAIEIKLGDGKRRKKVMTSKTRSGAESKLRDLNPAIRAAGHRSRPEMMRKARAIATHKPSEWHAKVRSLPRTCRYCDTVLHHFNMVKDHMISIECGGSDGIDNVQPICWECNNAKHKTPHDKFAYKGVKPRPFRVLPSRLREYERVVAVRDARQG